MTTGIASLPTFESSPPRCAPLDTAYWSAPRPWSATAPAAADFLRDLAAQIEAIANAAQTTVGHVAVYGESMRSVDAMGDRLIRGE